MNRLPTLSILVPEETATTHSKELAPTGGISRVTSHACDTICKQDRKLLGTPNNFTTLHFYHWNQVLCESWSPIFFVSIDARKFYYLKVIAAINLE